LQIRKWRGFAPLALALLAFCACGPSFALAAARIPAASVSAAGIPVKVQGFIPGYTDDDLARLVSTCVAQVPVPGTIANETRSGWQVQVDVQNVSMPRTFTEIRVSLLHGANVVAFRWQRTMALSAAPQSSLCGVVSRLTQQLWISPP
jgi:hypothetical protein